MKISERILNEVWRLAEKRGGKSEVRIHLGHEEYYSLLSEKESCHAISRTESFTQFMGWLIVLEPKKNHFDIVALA